MKDTRLIALIERRMMKLIEARSKRDKVSIAEVVRRALTAYFERKKDN